MAKRLEFYDVGARESFFSTNWKLKTKFVKGKKRKYAVTKSKKGNYEVWKVLPSNF